MFLSAYESLRDRLAYYPDSKWGFVIYRCTYSSDEEWEKYMSILNTHVRARLASNEEELGDIFDRIDWNVQEDPRYEGMSDDEIRMCVPRSLPNPPFHNTPRTLPPNPKL